MPKKPMVENAKERDERLELEAQQKREEAAREDRAIDEMIRQNIALNGP